MLGLVVRLPIFMNKRLVAFVTLCAMVLIAPVVNGLKTRKDVALESKAAESAKSEEAEGKAKDNLSIDAKVDRLEGTISGTITNSSPIAYQNVKAKCIVSGESGKKINTLKIEILKVVKASGDTKFNGVSAGYIDPQAYQFNCNVTDAERYYSASPQTNAHPAQ